MKKTIDKKYIILAVIFIVAVAVRTIGFGAVPGGFNQDGVMAAVDAKALSQYGTDRFGMRLPVHFTAWGFGQMSVLMSYLMVPFIKLFGLNVITARLPCLICSLLGLLFLWLFSKKTFNIKAAMTISAFAAICPWHIMQSRWALDCNLFPHFLIAGICFLLYGLKGRKIHIVLSMLCFGLSMYCYGISIYTVPLLLVALSVYLVASRQMNIKTVLLSALVYLAVAWPFILCMILNAFNLETLELPFCTIPVFHNSIRGADIVFMSDKPLQQLLDNLVSILKIIFQCSHDPLHNEIPGFGTVYIISILFFLIGFFRMIKGTKRNTGAAFVLIFFAVAFLNGLITRNVNINRANMIFYPMIIMTGDGIYFTATKIRYAKIAIPIVYAALFACFTISYFTSYADEIKEIFLEDFGKAVSYASSLGGNKIYITPDSQYEGFAHVSEILTLYYADVDSADYRSGEFSKKYSFTNDEDAEITVKREPESADSVKFGRFYVTDRRTQ